MFASCGQERDIILWQGNTMRKVGARGMSNRTRVQGVAGQGCEQLNPCARWGRARGVNGKCACRMGQGAKASTRERYAATLPLPPRPSVRHLKVFTLLKLFITVVMLELRETNVRDSSQKR